MDRTYWHKQAADQPLFPDLLWSRPETKRQAGKLLIVGGSAHGFAAPAEAYGASVASGVGLTRVLLPHHVKKLLPSPLANQMEFAPSNPSGSFAQSALAEVLDASEWADGVLMAGDLGRNSETAIVLEQFAIKYHGLLTLAQDAVDYYLKTPADLLSREQTLLVLEFPQLQKLAVGAGFTTAFSSGMDFLHLVEALHEFTVKYKTYIVIEHVDTIFVAVYGQVSTTKLGEHKRDRQIKTAAQTSVWWLQNPTKPFEAITSALISN
jgi:ADP-dependent NAD(P)H-hydrate dehydratase / NAD(P)H-hydrate epimerase